MLPSHSIFVPPSRSSLPPFTSDGRTRGAQHLEAENIEHLVHTPHGLALSWSDRCGNARTDSCMSRGHTARVGNVLSTLGSGSRAHPQRGLTEPVRVSQRADPNSRCEASSYV